VNIVEIYEDDIKFMWDNNKTFLCVFDKNNNFITDYDLCSGIKLMKKDDRIIFYVYENEIVQGKWIFFADRVSEDYSREKLVIYGESAVGLKTRKFNDTLPWKNCGSQKFVTRSEREKRLSICKECPFFNIEKMTCNVDSQLVLDSTRGADRTCPEGKWGERDRILAELSEQEGFTQEPAYIIETQDQLDFENELEEFLKGLE
jgi:hypothetical protein